MANITFLFTDIEGNTGLWSKFPEKVTAVFRRHDELIETIAKKYGGQVVRPRGEGDSRFVVFTQAANALNAVLAAAAIQKALHDEPWPISERLRVRIALHTGDGTQIDQDYYGLDVNHCAAIRTLAYGCQTLLSAKTAQLVQASLPPHLQLRDLHYHYLKGEPQREQIFQLVIPDLPNEFLPLKKQPLPGIVKNQQSAEERKRQALIENVQHDWIDGVLNRSLQQSIMLNLGITFVPTAVTPLASTPNKASADQSNFAQASQTAIAELYQQFGNQLLILGAPGSGKTTVLMLLASTLLGEAEMNNSAPLPVIFNLSSWVSKRSHLDVWLVEELERQFRVPKAIGRNWVQKQQILPLLDGLDEVTFGQRAACVAAIQEYQKTYNPKGLVVCCRSREYREIGKKLTLNGAIEVQPLTFTEIEAYFRQLGGRFNDLMTRLQQDNVLRELITSPLLVSIITVVQEDLPKVNAAIRSDAYRTLLFKTYVEHTLAPSGRHQPPAENEPFYEPASGPYSLAQTQRWLHWLAIWLDERNETTFYIEHLQPDALSKVYQRWYKLLLALGLALVIGLFVGLGVNDLNIGIVWATAAWLMLMLLGNVKTDNVRIDDLKTAIPIDLPWHKPLGNALLLGCTLGIAEATQMWFSAKPDPDAWVITLIATLSQFVLVSLCGFIGSWAFAQIAPFLYQGLRHLYQSITLPITVALWIACSISMGLALFYLLGLGLGVQGYSFAEVYQRSASVGLVALICGNLFILLSRKIQVVERLQWSWRPALLFIFLVVVSTLLNQPKTAMMAASVIASSGLTGLTTIEARRRPNQGILRSAGYAAFGAGIGIGLSFCLWFIFKQYVPAITESAQIELTILPAVSLLAALRSGLLPCLQHLLIRCILWWDGILAFDLAHFLETMVSNSLLYRTGGGYIFIHRLLLEYFLDLPEN